MQILIVALIVVLLFGGKRLGELGKGLGAGIRNFKAGVAGDDTDDADAQDQREPRRAQRLQDPKSPVNR